MTRRHPITTRSDTLFPSTTLCLSPAELTAPSPVLAPGVYGDMVMRAKEYIAAGDIFKVVLAQRFTTPFPLPPIDLYRALRRINRSEEHTSELQSLMRISYAVFCLITKSTNQA